MRIKLPDAKYPGDVCTLSDNLDRGIILLVWDGQTWRHPYEVFVIDKHTKSTDND